MVEKLNLTAKHMLMLILPLLLLVVLFIFKSQIVENFVNYFELNYLSKYRISDEFIRYSSVQLPKEKKINIQEIVAVIPVSKVRLAKGFTPEKIPEERKQIKETPYKLSFIYVGENKKFVEINGRFYSEGDYISQGKKIVRIEKNKVLIDILGRKKWLFILN